MSEKDFNIKEFADSVSEALTLKIKEQVFSYNDKKLEETSGLHRDILNKIKGLEDVTSKAIETQNNFNNKVIEHMADVKPIIDDFKADAITRQTLIRKDLSKDTRPRL